MKDKEKIKSKQISKKLKHIGYDRGNREYRIQNSIPLKENFKDKTLNHSIISNCKVKSEFDNASVTGSIFKKCEFEDCSINQTDFEFCSFSDSRFTASQRAIASFNNSNFINTAFENINFEFCTFTGALFENCVFKDVKIENSTFENAIFKNCSFTNVKLFNANTDFIELDDPKMENATLSLSQIPYMFGGLEYFFSTSDHVMAGSQNGGVVGTSEYKNRVIPLLVKFWEMNKSTEAEYYFPLANVYLASKDYNRAVTNLRLGLKDAVIQHDFRMIKFYCKLISRSRLFDSSALYNFYNLIKRFGTSNENFSLSDSRSFIRNIGEIESVLFASYKKGKLFLRLRTNLSMVDADKIGLILGKIFSFSKMRRAVSPNQVEMTLTENSPLIISLHIDGTAENVVMLLNSFLSIAGLTESQAAALSVYSLCSLEESAQMAAFLAEEADEILGVCCRYDIKLFLMEYCIENCREILPEAAKTYCYFNNMDANHWQNRHIALT